MHLGSKLCYLQGPENTKKKQLVEWCQVGSTSEVQKKEVPIPSRELHPQPQPLESIENTLINISSLLKTKKLMNK